MYFCQSVFQGGGILFPCNLDDVVTVEKNEETVNKLDKELTVAYEICRREKRLYVLKFLVSRISEVRKHIQGYL